MLITSIPAALLSSLIDVEAAVLLNSILFIFKKYIILTFTLDIKVVELGINMIFILALVQLPKGANIVLSYRLRGGVDIKWLIWIIIVSVFIFEINLVFTLVFFLHLHSIGIWAVKGIDELSRVIVNYIRFYKKDWKNTALNL
ncbi:MAG: hypothetical protein KAR38_03420 [Calditrichia bacterium]|nr:hypothetical protein [Calditrichia bacterium]